MQETQFDLAVFIIDRFFHNETDESKPVTYFGFYNPLIAMGRNLLMQHARRVS